MPRTASGGTTRGWLLPHPAYPLQGGKRDQPEDACPAGSTSPPKSTSAADCTGGPAPPPSGDFTQVHVAYAGKPGILSVDFVGGSGSLSVWTSLDNATWKQAAASSFSHPTIGYMSQALLDFSGVQAGAKAYYKVGSPNTTSFAVVPIVTRPEVFAVYGDFGTANDVCMDSLIAGAAKGEFDSVLHVGGAMIEEEASAWYLRCRPTHTHLFAPPSPLHLDWGEQSAATLGKVIPLSAIYHTPPPPFGSAYNFEDSGSQVGNQFMVDIQPFAATHPVMPAEGEASLHPCVPCASLSCPLCCVCLTIPACALLSPPSPLPSSTLGNHERVR